MRDISHSSVERVMMPDATMLVDYMFTRYIKIIKNLNVYPDNMLKNIYLTKGVIFSQRILTSLIDKGLSREEAYDLIQPFANYAYENNLDFKELILNDFNMNSLYSKEELNELFNLNYYKRNVEYIYNNIFN